MGKVKTRVVGTDHRLYSIWCNFKPSTVYQRFYCYGWSVEQSLGLEKRLG